MYMDNCKTVPLRQGSDEWLAWRRGGIGGSEIAAILGASQWDSPLSVWAKKVGIDASPTENSSAMEWGQRLESAVVEKWIDEHPSYQIGVRSPVFERTDIAWARASLDCIVVAPDGEFEAIEAKTTASRSDWFDANENETIPEYYRWQAVWQMAVTGMRAVHFSVLVLNNSREWISRTLDRDEIDISHALDCAEQFWRHVEANSPPPLSQDNPLSDSGALKKMHPGVHDNESVETGDEGEKELDMLIALEARKSDIERQIEVKRNFFKSRMGEAKAVTANGRKVCSAFTAERTTVDSKSLKSGNPDAFERYSKTSTYKTYRFVI